MKYQALFSSLFQKSNNVSVINTSGTNSVICLLLKNGFKDPCCVAYRYMDDMIIVGSNSGKLLVFKIAS